MPWLLLSPQMASWCAIGGLLRYLCAIGTKYQASLSLSLSLSLCVCVCVCVWVCAPGLRVACQSEIKMSMCRD